MKKADSYQNKYDQDKVMISTILETYMTNHGSKLASREVAFKAVDNLLEFFGDQAVDVISCGSIDLYIEERQIKSEQSRGKILSYGTLRRELVVLRAALNHCMTRGLLDSIPSFRLPPESDPHDLWLSKEDIKTLRHHTMSEHVNLFIILALFTAGRKQSILDLTWPQVDFEMGLIDLNTPNRKKTNKKRAVVPMNDQLKEMLLVQKEKATTDYVIEYKGNRVRNIKKGFERTKSRAASAALAQNNIEMANRLSKTVPHTLRHTAASWMAQDGKSMNEIAKFLGHSIQKTTERYAHLAPEHLIACTDSISKNISLPSVSNSTDKYIILPAEEPVADNDYEAIIVSQMCILRKLRRIDPKNKKTSREAGSSVTLSQTKVLIGAGDEIRTHDPNLGKVMLYP